MMVALDFLKGGRLYLLLAAHDCTSFGASLRADGHFLKLRCGQRFRPPDRAPPGDIPPTRALMSAAQADTIIGDSLWAAESLIEDAEKAFG